MKLSVSSLAISVLFAGLLLSCKKGDVGPQGEPGTANVIYSPWFKPNSYKKDTLYGSWGFFHEEAAPAITQRVLDSGTVITFAKLLGYVSSVWPANQVAQLPITITYVQGSVTSDTWTAQLRPGLLRIRFVNDRNFYTSLATGHQFRYIIIPGGQPTGRTAPLSYEELCAQYKIPE